MTEQEQQLLLAENIVLREQLTGAAQLIAQLQARVAALEQLKTPPPPFIKPNRPPPAPAPKGPRKKRDPAHNHGRPRATPTEVRTHAYDTCPTCAYPLTGQSIARRREVLDLLSPPPVRVIEYQILKRYCPHCAQWREPALTLAGVVIGQGRVSVRILALIAWLRTCLRLPVRQIQRYLAALHGLDLSVGEICAGLATVAEEGAATARAIKAELRAAPALHMDETGWRENGQNGYIWVMTNPAGVSCFHYDHSRAGTVARRLSGAHYAGTLGSDFYAGYNEHQCRHQRCWAHLIRDLVKLEAEHGTVAEVTEWVGAVCRLYREGADVDGRAPPSPAERDAKATVLQQRAHKLGLQWARVPEHPARALSQRLLRHEGELFEFVRQAEVAATNNVAERVLRPLVMARKISGGTRSAAGSQTRMRLQTFLPPGRPGSRTPCRRAWRCCALKLHCPHREQLRISNKLTIPFKECCNGTGICHRWFRLRGPELDQLFAGTRLCGARPGPVGRVSKGGGGAGSHGCRGRSAGQHCPERRNA